MAAIALTACSALNPAPQPTTGPQPALAECRDESYDFVGEGTLAGLGLDVATPVPPPEPDRMAMIWVTHREVRNDSFPPDSGVRMTRMLCFEFADGSGGSEWPVHPAWRAPRSGSLAPGAGDVPLSPLMAIGALLVIAISVIAFRRGSR